MIRLRRSSSLDSISSAPSSGRCPRCQSTKAACCCDQSWVRTLSISAHRKSPDLRAGSLWRVPRSSPIASCPFLAASCAPSVARSADCTQLGSLAGRSRGSASRTRLASRLHLTAGPSTLTGSSGPAPLDSSNTAKRTDLSASRCPCAKGCPSDHLAVPCHAICITSTDSSLRPSWRVPRMRCHCSLRSRVRALLSSLRPS